MEIDQNNLRLKFSALNVNFNGGGLHTRASKKGASSKCSLVAT